MILTRDRKKTPVSESCERADCDTQAKSVTVFAVVFFCALLLSFGACYLGEPATFTDDTAQTTAGYTSEIRTEEPGFIAGETADISEVLVTMVAIKESLGNEYWNPQTGFVYLICEFEIINNSEAEINISSILSFETHVDGKKRNLSLMAGVTNDIVTADGNVLPGETLHGSVGYEVPESWKKAEIRFSPDMRNKNSALFRIEKAQLVSR